MRTRKLILPAVCLTTGMYLLISQIIFPLYRYRAQQKLVNPVAGAYTSFWEEQQGLLILEEPQTPPPPFFYLSIPSIELKEAPVETNSTKAPNQSLIHIKGTALPGNGTRAAANLKIPIVISGHSVSPLFFSAKDPKTLFTNLPKLKVGEDVIIDFRNENYTYSIEKKKIVKPKELWDEISKEAALEQAELVLFTCVPPGLRTNRLIIFAQASEKPLN
jgi:LPXTG-site transpeptidase (sortase) family protein